MSKTWGHRLHSLHVMKDNSKPHGVAKLFLDGDPLYGVQELSVTHAVGDVIRVEIKMIVKEVTQG